MANSSPWHSIEPGRTVYHDDTRCVDGNNIETRYFRRGTGNRRRCFRCELIAREDAEREAARARIRRGY